MKKPTKISPRRVSVTAVAPAQKARHKRALCCARVPAVLHLGGTKAIEPGTVVEYTRQVFFNGEFWLRFPNGGQAPSVFFETIA